MASCAHRNRVTVKDDGRQLIIKCADCGAVVINQVTKPPIPPQNPKRK